MIAAWNHFDQHSWRGGVSGWGENALEFVVVRGSEYVHHAVDGAFQHGDVRQVANQPFDRLSGIVAGRHQHGVF